MVANRGTLRSLSWALVVLAVMSAAVTLLFEFGPLLPDPDPADDLVDQLQFMRTQDEAAFPFVVLGSVATLGVYLIVAMIGVALRAWAAPTPTRDGMSLLLVLGGAIGIGSQLLKIAVSDAARPFLCDCGYRAEEMIGLDRALAVGGSSVNWLIIGAHSLIAAGVFLAPRVVEVSSAWRTLSYAIGVGVLLAVAFRVVAAFVFIDAFDPFQLSNLIAAATAAILVPIWAVLLARDVREPDVHLAAAPA